MRYQKLRYGDRSIRRAISTYFTHQATECSHLFKPGSPNLTEVAFEQRLRDCYEVLVHSLAEEALDRLHIEYSRRDSIRPDLTKVLWQEYEMARAKYKFYWDYLGKQRPLGKMGVVGFPQNQKGHQQIDEMLKGMGMPYESRDLTEIGFAHFIRTRRLQMIELAQTVDILCRNELVCKAGFVFIP